MSPDRSLLEAQFGAGALAERPHLFSDSFIELPAAELAVLAGFVQAVTTLVSLPAYQSAIGIRDGINTTNATPGVCLGFDFHRTPDGPKLIEINTNAGGSLLVTLLNRAWQQNALADAAEQGLLGMFMAEWQAWGADRPLKTIAIVDENPEQQYLYPEFVRWQKLFETQGIHTIICPPELLSCDTQGLLSYQGQAIHLLYNRLTDFSLTGSAEAIAQSWQCMAAGAKSGTLITPHPVAHALWADKRNLDWLSDPEQLDGFGLSAEAIAQIVRCVPRTVSVDASQTDYFWANRKFLFFKPQAGFGSRATYRGEKLTKRVFEEILQGGYVAQAFVPPPELSLASANEAEQSTVLKYDLRVYAYNGQIQLLAARLYQGQTTNFRTPGGGFAPIRVI